MQIGPQFQIGSKNTITNRLVKTIKALMQNSIFLPKTIHTTSESEGKATRIVLGTTYNTELPQQRTKKRY